MFSVCPSSGTYVYTFTFNRVSLNSGCVLQSNCYLDTIITEAK